MNLIIVESPNKAKTIQKLIENCCNEKWMVVATKGHIIDLPKKEVGILKKENDYDVKWKIEEGKQKLIQYIKSLIPKAKNIFIATDDDREGEKIADDVVKQCNIQNYIRVKFLEITKKEIEKQIKLSLQNPQQFKIDKHTRDSAEVRRLIDRYIGYPISTIIKKAFKEEHKKEIPKGVGRVIIPSLGILVDLEQQIRVFIPEDINKVIIRYSKNGLAFAATNPTSFKANQNRELNEFLFNLNTAPHIVEHYQQKTEDRKPPNPLITSTLQYGAWYLYKFKPRYTMKLAQVLFETGLITYHRTDSYRISEDAQVRIIELLYKGYGDKYTLSEPRAWKNKGNTQNAHEAIRPTIFNENGYPKNILSNYENLTQDHQLLYQFIWYRTLATQMKDSIYDVSRVLIDIGGNKFEARANHQIFNGWEALKPIIIKNTNVDEEEVEIKNRDIQLPEFIIGEELTTFSVETYVSSTHRPKRYGIGRFVTTLFNNGIARPSTLDGIIETLEEKKYIEIKSGMLYATSLAEEIIEWVKKNAYWLYDLEHTKKFEDDLEEIIYNKKDPKELIDEYYLLIDDLAKRLGYSLEEIVSKNQKSLKADKEIIAKCPACKHKSIYVNEKGIVCNEYNCKFVLWINQIENFFFNIGHNRNRELYVEYIKQMLNSPGKKLYFVDLVSKKKNTKYNAYIGIKKNQEGYYGLNIEFPKSKNIPDNIIKAADVEENFILNCKISKVT